MGPEISFSIFYVVPVAMTAWYAGYYPALLTCGLTASTWLFADLTAGQVYSSWIIPVWNASVRLGFFLIITHLLLALHASLQREATMADTDALTGLANSRRFYEVLDAELARSRRSRQAFTLAYLDADNFKQVNDSLGHAEGDRVLREIGHRLRISTRGADLPARLGGDEFAILFPDCDEAVARELLPKIQGRMLSAMKAGGWPVTFSIGAVTVGPESAGADEIVHAADELMYGVKTSGKNQIRYGIAPRSAPAARVGGGGRDDLRGLSAQRPLDA